MLQITFAPGGQGPLYQQLYRAVTDQIRSGQLRAGEKCPASAPWRGSWG